MEQKYTLGILALSIIAVLGISLISAQGFGFGKSLNSANELTDEEKATIEEERTAMETAITNGDYATWKSLMDEKIAKMQAELTEENFNKIVEQHKKMSEFRTTMEQARNQFCESNDCPEQGSEDGDGFMRKGMMRQGPGMR